MATIIDPPNSIWPNGLKTDNKEYVIFYPLGTNKVDISTVIWPDGDELSYPFVYKNKKLVGFCDTSALTVSSNTVIYLPYEHIEVNFPEIEKGSLQIYAPNATVKKVFWKDTGIEDIPEAQFKYKGCTTVDNIIAVDANYQTTDVVDGVWSEPLWDLTSGYEMFYRYINLTSFNGDLPNLTNGFRMFNLCRFTSFSSDLSSLTKAYAMFGGCPELTSFSSNLSSLTNGYYMFGYCEKLTSFTSDLSSLTDGTGMFEGCKLDAPSVKNIIDTINTYSGVFDIGMGCDDTTEDKDLFAQEAGYDNMTELLGAFKAKKWGVNVQYTGRPTSTYSLRKPSTSTLPVFVKLEETEDYPNYISEDGSKKYRLHWFHETTGSTKGYTQFASLEEAIEHFRIKLIERNQSEE